MIHWKESAAIFSRLATLAAERRRAALATVVQVSGSAYRRPGAKLLIVDTGDTLGGVSGGCMEGDIREIARGVMDTRIASLRHYDAGEADPIMGLGLGCNGVVDIFVQPATPGDMSSLVTRMCALLAGDAPVAIATVIADGREVGATMAIELCEHGETCNEGSLGDADFDRLVAEHAVAELADGRSTVHLVAGRQVFIEILQPPAHLIVCGGGADAVPLVRYAADVGFRVTLLDHREAMLASGAFSHTVRSSLARPDDADIVIPASSRSLAVVKTHSLAHDREWVRLLLARGVPYIGVLGPRGRTEAILGELCGEAGPSAARGRVFGPVGLDLGADGPEQIAISIVAELLAFIAKREPRHLWQRQHAIHSE
jgi:xanthine/CO dehydrogenase XdhC/CoxF family maturation factor